jgi:hypothetical protein
MGVEHALRGGTQHIETRIPENQTTVWTSHYARIDLTVRMPAGLSVQVHDGSGELSVSGTGALVLRDGSGSIDVRKVSREVTIHESGSGSVALQRVNTVTQVAAE